ncbi:hypothetical protein TNCV_4151031 [Trichonephila clavipes]|nr:hypothetical protein TNCV_4151031 [Trichonephila clavipes]
MTTCIPELPCSSFKRKTRPSSIWSFTITSPSWDMNEQMPYFSSFSDEWSRGSEKCSSTETAFMSRRDGIGRWTVAARVDVLGKVIPRSGH